MPDAKTSALTEMTVIDDLDDYVPVVDTSVADAAKNKRIKLGTLAGLNSDYGGLYSTTPNAYSIPGLYNNINTGTINFSAQRIYGSFFVLDKEITITAARSIISVANGGAGNKARVGVYSLDSPAALGNIGSAVAVTLVRDIGLVDVDSTGNKDFNLSGDPLVLPPGVYLLAVSEVDTSVGIATWCSLQGIPTFNLPGAAANISNQWRGSCASGRVITTAAPTWVASGAPATIPSLEITGSDLYGPEYFMGFQYTTTG